MDTIHFGHFFFPNVTYGHILERNFICAQDATYPMSMTLFHIFENLKVRYPIIFELLFATSCTHTLFSDVTLLTFQKN
jgi:hypothetical protein